jgi:hypothetical protein
MSIPKHEHFCWQCYGNGAGQGGISGWWGCVKKPCTTGREALCRFHREKEEAKTRHQGEGT